MAGRVARARLVALSFLMLFVELALIRWTAANNIHLAYLTRRTHPRIRPGCVNPSGMLHAAAILSPSLELPQVVLAAFVARFELRSARRRAYEPRRRRWSGINPTSDAVVPCV
jgi:hypothetical protein